MKRRAIVLAALLAGIAPLAGCGTASAPAGHVPAPKAPPGGSNFLDTSAVVGSTTWAVVVMGGSVASENNFWQLFVRRPGAGRWQLATPPGVADNGGLVLAGETSKAVITAFRPSQYLTFTPLTETGNSGRSWSSTEPIHGALADTPGALAVGPVAGQLLALLATGKAELGASGSTRWRTLASQAQLAATAAGKRCGVTQLTAAAFTPAGTPMLAGACEHPGTAGIFVQEDGTWQLTGPRLSAATGREPTTVRALTRTTTGNLALLTAGTGHDSTLYAAESNSSGTWVLSSALNLSGAGIASVSFGPGGTLAVITTDGRAATMTNVSQGWQELPQLPARTVTLAPGNGTEALAVNRGTLDVWQLTPDHTSWQQIQQINVPIQYGTSG